MNYSNFIFSQTTTIAEDTLKRSPTQGYESQAVYETLENIELIQRFPVTSDGSEAVNPTEEEDSDYPDGGARAYTVLFGAFLGFTIGTGLINSVGAVQSYLNTHQLKGISSSLSALIISLFVAVGYISSIFSGVLFDEFGTKLPLISGCVLLFVGLFGTGECNSIISFIFVFGIITGTSLGFLTTPCSGVVTHYFRKKRASAFGIATFGGSLGGIIFPLILDVLYRSVGFQWTMRILAFICLSISLMALVLMKERLKPISSVRNLELPLGKRLMMSLNNVLSLSKRSIDFRALKDPNFLVCALASAFTETSLVCVLTYFASYVVFIGYSSTQASTLLTITNALGLVGRYFPGLIADKIGSYNVMIVMNFGIVASTLGLWWGWCMQNESKSSLYCFVVVYGVFNSSFFSLALACLSAISPTRDFGKRYATLSVILGVAIICGLTAGGAILGVESRESYRNFVIYCSSLAFAGEITWILARFLIVESKFKVKV